MLMSIHPIVDQIAQWIDGQICRRNKDFRKLPLNLRLYVVLRGADDKLGFIKRIDSSRKIEYWDPFEIAATHWEAEKLGKERHLLPIEEAWDVPEEMASKYMRVLIQKLTMKFVIKCLREVEPVFIPIREGYFKIVGWDEHGRMEFDVSAQGSQRLGSEEGERFISFIGLQETGRVHE